MECTASKPEHDAPVVPGHLAQRIADIDGRESAWLSAALEARALGPDHGLLSPVFSAAEGLELQRVTALQFTPTPSAHRHVFVVLKATRLCNLRCTYCHSWRSGRGQVMTFGVMAETIRMTQETPGIQVIDYVWHGGETTTLKQEYFSKALWLQQLFRRPGQTISNSIQTNGTLLTARWARFFADNAFMVGVSVDGPEAMHDRKRVDARGNPTFAKVVKGLRHLRDASVPYGLLVVVDRDLAAVPPETLLAELATLDSDGVSLINAIPENTPTANPSADDHLPFDEYVKFLQGIFAVWSLSPERYPRIREISGLIDGIVGAKSSVCTLAGNCMGQFLTIEPSGSTAACDKYIGDPDYSFSSRGNSPFASANLTTARARELASARQMRSCPNFNVCNGGCPHDNRLQRLFNSKWNGNCCGLAPLIEDIKFWQSSADAATILDRKTEYTA